MESISFDFEIKDGFAVVKELLTYNGYNIKIKQNDKYENIIVSIEKDNKHIKFEYPKATKFSTIKKDIKYYIDVGEKSKSKIVDEMQEIISENERGWSSYTSFDFFDGEEDGDVTLDGHYQFEAIKAIYEAAEEIRINKRLKNNIAKE